MEITITRQERDLGRLLYAEFQRGMSGGFYTSLFETIARSKGPNTYRMALGFPAEVYAYFEFTGMLDRCNYIRIGDKTGE